jgi:hypothetical protein
MSQFGTQTVQIGAQTANTVAAPIIGKAVAGSIGMTAGMATALVGGGIAVAAMAVTMWIQRNALRGQQRIQTTAYVNELAPLLQANVDAFLAGPKTRESQIVALQTFDDAWAWLSGPQACGNPAMGEAGRNCISERGRNARPRWDACPPEGCQNWFEAFRDPIANTPVTEAQSVASAEQLMQVLTGQGRDATPILIGLTVVALLVVLS